MQEEIDGLLVKHKHYVKQNEKQNAQLEKYKKV